MQSENEDNPGVVVFPPLLALATVVLGLALSHLVPLSASAAVLAPVVRIVIGTLLGIAGAALAIAGSRTFRHAGTNVAPTRPALLLVTGGIYRHLRNPMYVGLGLIIAGIGIGFASEWTLLLLIPAALILHYGVVLREERYLSRKFGDDYRRFCSEVPRYGWRV
jgi:protein-S-isoprenylcysteine O-methyltransferase Ste14